MSDGLGHRRTQHSALSTQHSFLHASEDVVWQAGQHWIVPVKRSALPALLALGCLVVALGAGHLRAAWPAPWPLIATVALGGLGLLALGRLIWVYLDWIDDALIVTTERVVWLQKTAFFHEQRREIPLHRVQNVAIVDDGPLARALRYGDVIIEAAGGSPIAVTALPRPQALRQRLFAVQTWRQARRDQQNHAALDAAVRAVLNLPNPASLPPAGTGEVVIHLPNGQTLLPGGQAPGSGADVMADDGPLVWRRHWWYLVRGAARPVLLLALANVGLVLLIRQPATGPPELAFALTLLLIGLAALGAGAVAWAVLVWRAERYVLDGDRLFDIAGLPFGLRREVKETRLDNVQDLGYRIPHPLAHLLDFGHVVVETSGETQRFTFDGVARPRAVHAAISHRLAASRAADDADRQHQVRDEMLHILHAYHHATAHPDTSEAADPTTRTAPGGSGAGLR